MSFTRPFLLGPLFFRIALPCSGGYHLREVGWHYMMRLGQTMKRAQLLKIRAQISSILAKGCILMIVCVLSNLTLLPLLGGGIKSWNVISYTFAASLSIGTGTVTLYLRALIRTELRFGRKLALLLH